MTGYGEGYPNNKPERLKIEVGIGTDGGLVDISNDVVRTSVRIHRDASSQMVIAEWDLVAWTDLIGGSRYVIQDWQAVHITDPATNDAWFMGYIMEPTDRVHGAEKTYHIACQSVQVDLQKPTRQITTQYPPGDGTPVVAASPLTPIPGPGRYTFSLISTTSLRHLYAEYFDSRGRFVRGRRCIAQNWDGTNREVLTVVAISGLNVTADFVSAKNLQVPPGGGTPSWSLSGGLPAYDLVAGGFKATNEAGVLTEYQSLIDEYYNTPGGSYEPLTVLKNAVGETHMSLPHTKVAATTPYDALQSLVEIASEFNYRRTCTSSFTPGTNRVITPDSMTGIYEGDFIYMANPDGSNPERQMVKAVTGTTFTSNLSYYKTGSGSKPWIINTGTAPVCYMTWDNSFTRQLVFQDLYNFDLVTPIELTDKTVIGVTEAHYDTGYERRISGVDRGSKITVIGHNNAQGSYEDTAMSAAMGRVVELPPVVRDDLLTNADCVAVAQQIVVGFGKSKETLQSVSTHQLISNRPGHTSDLFRTAQIVSWTSALEGGTPAYYPIQDAELSYAEGIAKYTFTLGDRLAELGDKALPAYGAGSFVDRTPPSVPTWAAGNAWVLSNQYNRRIDRTVIRVQATLGGELDLAEAHFAYRVNGGAWNYSPPVPLVGGATLADWEAPPVPPASVVDFQAWVIDSSPARNFSGFSSVASVTAQGVVPPDPPTNLHVTRNYFNGRTGMVEIQVGFDPSPTPEVVSYSGTLCAWGYCHFVETVYGLELYEVVNPNVEVTVTITAWDSSGNPSAPSAPLTFTSVPGPPHQSLYNGDFTILSPASATTPDGWTETPAVGGSGVLVNNPSLPKVATALRMTCPAGGSDTWLSEKVSAISADSASGTQFQLYARCVFAAAAANGKVQIAIKHYDASHAVIKTSNLYALATPPTTTLTVTITVASPVHTSYSRLYLYTEGPAISGTTVATFAACELAPAGTSSGSAAGLMQAGDTTGHLAVPTVAGTPTGVPDLEAGSAGMVVETDVEQIGIYVNGTYFYAPLSATSGLALLDTIVCAAGDVVTSGGKVVYAR